MTHVRLAARISRRRYALRRLLTRDPGALLLAENGDGALTGSVIAGRDGWRGTIYRLAVAPAQRRRGLGSRLHCWRASHWQEQAERLRFTAG